MPFELRVPLAYHHDLALAVQGVAARVTEGWYREQGHALGILDPRTGSITAVQRFGSDLLLETDAPGTYVHESLRRAGEPAEARTVLEALAVLRGMEALELEGAIADNAARVLCLG